MNKCTIIRDYSVNVCGLPIPKNSICGKIGTTYYYFDDFSQFRNNALVDVYILTSEDKSFKKCLIRRGENVFIRHIEAVIKKYNLYDVKCVYPLKMRKDCDKHAIPGFIAAKQAQTDFTFRPSNQDTKRAITDYACGKMLRWVDWR